MRRQAKASHASVARRRRTQPWCSTPLCDASVRRILVTSFVLTSLVLAACGAPKPPRDFAPDPGLVARIREIQISTTRQACPGQAFAAYYTAILDDGSRIPFETRYDEDRPPRLHIVFLDRSSPDAEPLKDGGWRAEEDPVRTVRTGFRLTAVLRANPAMQASATLAPEYACQRHVLRFEGSSGYEGRPGGDGPDVTVRLAMLRSPFSERLLVAGVEVGRAPPFYVLADANTAPPRDWLIVRAAGGSGATGVEGERGQAGAAGQPGCPGSDGATGGRGGAGGAGGAGGRGGRMTIIAPSEEPFMAGLVAAESPGGPGGKGGKGGPGGKGGAGGSGTTQEGRRCGDGRVGQAGERGLAGSDGSEGPDGPRPRTITVPMREVLGTNLPPELAELLGR